MKRGYGKITRFVRGPSDKTIAMLRRVNSSRDPKQSVTSKPREVNNRYGSPNKPTMPTLRFLEEDQE